MERKKCIVMKCANHSDEGEFVGEMCSPCHRFVTTGRGVHSQAYRNARQIEPRRMVLDLEFMPEAEEVRRKLTCIFCDLLNCDHTFTLRGHGITVCGLHVKCLDAHEQTEAALRNLL